MCAPSSLSRPLLWSLSSSLLLLSLSCLLSSLLLSSLLSSLIEHTIGQQGHLHLCQLCRWDGLCHAPSHPVVLSLMPCFSHLLLNCLVHPHAPVDCHHHHWLIFAFLFPPALLMTPSLLRSSLRHCLPPLPSLPHPSLVDCYFNNGG
jgi:hypothetical protein